MYFGVAGGETVGVVAGSATFGVFILGGIVAWFVKKQRERRQQRDEERQRILREAGQAADVSQNQTPPHINVPIPNPLPIIVFSDKCKFDNSPDRDVNKSP